jgi:O-antigen/teichoic acid export membrane protein
MSGETVKPSRNARFLLNAFSNYAGQLITVGVWLFLTPFILNRIGATSYALWVLVGSVMAYGSLLDFGIAGAVTKYVAEYRAREDNHRARQLIATALVLYTIFGLAILTASAIIAPVFPALFNVSPSERDTAVQLVYLSGLAVGITIPATTSTAVLRGLQRFDLINLVSISGTLLSTLAIVVALLMGGGVISLVAIGIAVTVLMQIPTIWAIYRVAPELRFGFSAANREMVRTVVSFSSSLFLLNVGGRLETKTDEIVIGGFLPLAAVTPYNLARKISTLPQLLAEQFLMLIFPLASELHAENDESQLRSLYVISTRITLAVVLPLGCCLIVLAGPILSVWVGEEYAPYAYLVLLLTVASMIDTSQWPAGFVVQGMARHHFNAVVAFITGVSNLGLSLLLVRPLGLTGVALGTLIPTTVFCLGFILPHVRRVVGVEWHRVFAEMLLPPLLPLVPSVIVLFVLREALDPGSVLFLGVITASSLLTYLVGYLCLSVNAFERALFHRVALGAIRFTRMQVGRI